MGFKLRREGVYCSGGRVFVPGVENAEAEELIFIFASPLWDDACRQAGMTIGR